GPKSACTFSTNAAHAAASRTSSTRPAPWAPSPAIHFPIASAPVSEVDVPTTVAPARASACRMPSPMPREAPATIATWPFSMSAPARSRGERGRIRDGDALGVRGDALAKPGEHLARRAFDDALHALSREELHGLDPAHRMVELLEELRADVGRIARGAPRTVVDHRHPRHANLDR